jgi:peptidoglycan/LPS O-acetylase OafA/YrhL
VRNLRPEIQALRAAAVSLVVAYHLFPAALPGGFIGVDVFFAISGFLITSQLLREVDRSQQISLLGFWGRRARRIAPAALLVLAVCILATLVWVPDVYWSQYFAEIQASTVHVQNWHLANAAVDYLAAANDPSPVQHFWTLSAEEQFYVMWPLLIALALFATRGRLPSTRRRAITVAFAAVTAASLGYAIAYTAANPAKAFFVTPTRAWEFGAGGLLALLPRIGSRDRVRAAASWLGLGAIALGALRYSSATPFPSDRALLPVLGALAVMWAGAPAGRWSPMPILALRPVQFVGDISYSVYLWHWPLLILAPFVVGYDLHLPAKLLLVAMTIVLAFATKVGVEDPVRTGALARIRVRWTYAVVAAGMLVVLYATSVGTSELHAHVARAERQTERVLAHKPNCFGAASRDPDKACNDPKLRYQVVPRPVQVEKEDNSPCKRMRRDDLVWPCAFGAPTEHATRTIGLLGDSHAAHWRAAVDVVAKDKHWRGVSISRTSCPFSQATKDLEEPARSQCKTWNREVVAWFRHHPEVSTVFVAQIAGEKVVAPHGADQFSTQVAGYAAAWRALPRTVKRIVVIRDTPKTHTATKTCVEAAVAKHKPAGTACAVPRRDVMHRDAAAVAAAHLGSERVQTVDLTRVFCSRSRCFPVIGGALVYRDLHHLTTEFATTLGPLLEREVDRLRIA